MTPTNGHQANGDATGMFADGSARPNPGPGGWGIVWVVNDNIRAEAHGHEAETTNNRMELRALIEAFKMLPPEAAIEIFSDSQISVNTITTWAAEWERQGWRRRKGEIKNLDLVQEVLSLYRQHPNCTVRWTPGHAGNQWNDYADDLATRWMNPELR